VRGKRKTPDMNGEDGGRGMVEGGGRKKGFQESRIAGIGVVDTKTRSQAGCRSLRSSGTGKAKTCVVEPLFFLKKKKEFNKTILYTLS
jgi:hypothetical protein